MQSSPEKDPIKKGPSPPSSPRPLLDVPNTEANQESKEGFKLEPKLVKDTSMEAENLLEARKPAEVKDNLNELFARHTESQELIKDQDFEGFRY